MNFNERFKELMGVKTTKQELAEAIVHLEETVEAVRQTLTEISEDSEKLTTIEMILDAED